MESIISKIPHWVVMLTQLMTLIIGFYVAYKSIRIFRLSWRSKNEQKDFLENKLSELNVKLNHIKGDSDIEFLIQQVKAAKKLSKVRIIEIEKSIKSLQSNGSNKEDQVDELRKQMKQHMDKIEAIDKYSHMFSESYQKLTDLQYSDEELFEYFEKELLPEAKNLALLERDSEMQHLDPEDLNKQSAKLARNRAYEMGVGAIWDSWYVDRMEHRSHFSTT